MEPQRPSDSKTDEIARMENMHVWELAVPDRIDSSGLGDNQDRDAWRALQGPSIQQVQMTVAQGKRLARAACCIILHQV